MSPNTYLYAALTGVGWWSLAPVAQGKFRLALWRVLGGYLRLAIGAGLGLAALGTLLVADQDLPVPPWSLVLATYAFATAITVLLIWLRDRQDAKRRVERALQDLS